MNTGEQSVWVFVGEGGRFPSGVFAHVGDARQAILKYQLTGVLTRYPVDELVFDWASRLGCLGMKPDKVAALTAMDIGRFTSASQDHFHFENGLES